MTESFDLYFNPSRFSYIYKQLIQKINITSVKGEYIRKTACLKSKNINVYIDTSDGVNEDLKMHEYCGRIKKVVEDSRGKKFIFFKSAYSDIWSEKICKIAQDNNGTVIPFFKWSFNNDFYRNVYQKRAQVIEENKNKKFEYDIGYFCNLKPYPHPKPSTHDPDISWADHLNFRLPGNSENTGDYYINSRKEIYQKLLNSRFKILHYEKLPYDQYVKHSFSCKVILNPPGVGEYTSRMFDQCYLGNCIVLRKNSYDQGNSWKSFLPEVDMNKTDWEDDMQTVIENRGSHAVKCKDYFDNQWSANSVTDYLVKEISKRI